MADFGTTTLYVLLIVAIWAGALAAVGARSRSMSLIHAARLILYACAAVASLSIIILTYAFAVSDFSISYVYGYSDRAMPLFYKLTAVWGGQSGSLLVWTWLLAVLAAWAVHQNQDRLRELLPYIIVVLAGVLVFFCLLLLLSANPFETFMVEIPSAGRGLNPLLQNAYMVTHPPALYVGYVGMAIPFAFAMAALIAGQTDESWIQAARPWALASWYFLTMGLVLGMLWAYEELGWGGYWAWDPVENAGLIPWLTSTAYIHSVMVQERRQMLKIWNMVLAILTFELTIFGTFLTRSGFIQSVHAFAQSDIGWYFLGFMLLVALVAAALIVWRRPLLRSRGELESLQSREYFFVLNNWVLLSAAFLVITLTIFPNISQHFGNKVTISAPAFNRWMIPIGMTLLFLTGVGPMIGWRKSTAAGLRRQFLLPGIVAVLVVVGLVLIDLRGGLPLSTFGLCAFVVATVIQELVRGTRSRKKKTGVDPLTALVGLFRRNRRRYGGYLVHVGVVLMYLGFAGEAYKEEAELSLHKGQRATIGRYTLRFDGLRLHRDEQKQMSTATLSVYRDGKRLGSMRPARWVYFKHQDQPTTEVDIRRSAREDLFVVLGGFDAQGGTATFKAIINPLVNWIWIGFILMTIGAGIALAPVRVRLHRTVVPAGALVILLLLVAPTWAGPAAGKAATHGDRPVVVKQVPDIERRLLSKLACMCENCPRLPLATCQCGFAGKEKAAIRDKIVQGWSEQRILKWYLEQRGPELGRAPFGQAALTTPPDTLFNRMAWLLPYALSGVGILVLLLIGRRWARSRRTPVTQASGTIQSNQDAPGAPTDGQRKAYEELLDRELERLE